MFAIYPLCTFMKKVLKVLHEWPSWLQSLNCKLICRKACIYWPCTLCQTSEASCLNICAYFGPSQLQRGQPQPWIWPAPLSSPHGDPRSLPPPTLPARTPPHHSCCYPNLKSAVKKMSSSSSVQKRSAAHPRLIPTSLSPLFLHWPP